MNLYLARLAGHGIGDKESFKNLTVDEYMDSALEAIKIGKQLGEKVILMGCSTGATVGLPAMAFDPEIAAGIYYSPNIEIVDQNTHLLRRPFGLSLAQSIKGSEYHRFEGMSNPSDSSVVFAIISKDGKRGVMISSYGAYSDIGLMNALEKIRIISPQNENSV